MIKNYVDKIANYQNKKVLITGAIVLFTVCFFLFDLGGLLGRVFTSISNLFSNVDGEVKQVIIKSDGYDEEIGGSIQITKMSDWISNDSVSATYEIETILQSTDIPRDVVVVLDTSSNVGETKMEKIKEEIKELISLLLLDSNNNMGIITFNTTSEILVPLTNSQDILNEAIAGITVTGERSYYKGLIKLEELLNNYQISDNRELVILFVTNGFSNLDMSNEKAQYKLIKEKYPNSKIYGIAYEGEKQAATSFKLASYLENISDYQMSEVDNDDMLLEAALNPKYYESFELIEYIDNDNFYIENLDDISVSVGTVSLKETDGTQRIIWTTQKNEFRTGNNATMNINLKLNSNLIKSEGLYKTSTKTSVSYNLNGSNTVSLESTDSTILKNGYKVTYNPNLPNGCEIDFDLEEIYYAHEEVNLSAKMLSCEGWQFQGWEVIDKVKHINDITFIMPTQNINVRGKWSKLYLNKTMEGSINSATYVATYNYTGAPQTFEAPFTGSYKIELWGASGGYALADGVIQTNTGLGSYTSGIINLTSSDKLYIYVGKRGEDGAVNYNAKGGYNGGGNGSSDVGEEQETSKFESAGAGGGATDIRLVNGSWNSFDSLKSRIMVAAGGAGGVWTVNTNIISGGGLTNAIYNKTIDYAAGTSYVKVTIATPNTTQTAGNAFGKGGNGSGPGNDSDGSPGAGGGYYGGYVKIAATRVDLAGGGSSFISGHSGCNAISQSSTSSKIEHTGQSVHYSNYKFIDTVMIDGTGYKWTNTKGSYVGMPTHDGKSTMVGNLGNGYAKITFLG